MAVDEQFALLNPADVFRPEIADPKVYLDQVVKNLKEHEKFQPRADVSDVTWTAAHEANLKIGFKEL